MNSKPKITQLGAIIWETDDRLWHRDGNKPAVICPSGDIEYWVNDRLVQIKRTDKE